MSSSNMTSSSNSEEKNNPPNDGVPQDWRFYAAFSTMCLVMLVVALDATMISTALPTISEELGGSAIEAFWAGTSFLLSSTICQPVFASFSNIFGRRPLIFSAVVIFTIGCIIGGTAHNFSALLAGRSIQGIGGGGILVLVEIIVTDLIPLRERGKWFGFISMMWALGSVSGPVIGGAFAMNTTWRWIFWINLPFCGLALFAIPAFITLHRRQETLVQKLLRVDWFGLAWFTAAITSFLVPVTWGGVQFAWSSWHTIVPLVLGALGLIGFVFYEMWVAEPLIPIAVFGNVTSNVTFFVNFIHGIILWCLLYYLPLYYEAVKGSNPVISGVSIFPVSFTVAPTALVIGLLCRKTGKYRRFIWVGWAFVVLGGGILQLLDVETSTVQWIFLTLIIGIGCGILFTPMAYATMASATDGHLASAMAMFSFFRVFGQCVGVAIGGTIFQNSMRHKLEAIPQFAPLAAAYARDASSLVQVLRRMPPSADKAQIVAAYAGSLKHVWVVLCVLASIAFVSSFFIKSLSVDRALNTEQGFRSRKAVKDAEYASSA